MRTAACLDVLRETRGAHRRAAHPDDLRVDPRGVRLGALRRRRTRRRRDEPHRRRPPRRRATRARARAARRADVDRRAAAPRGGSRPTAGSTSSPSPGTTGARDGVSPALAGLAERARAVDRRAALRRLRHLDAGAGARRGRSSRTASSSARAPSRSPRKARTRCASYVAQPPRGARPVEWSKTRRRPRLSCVLGQGACLQVDPPDLGFVATAVRLLRVWREQWRLVLVGFTCALATTGLSLAIPILIRHAIDNSIAPVNGHARQPSGRTCSRSSSSP